MYKELINEEIKTKGIKYDPAIGNYVTVENITFTIHREDNPESKNFGRRWIQEFCDQPEYTEWLD